MSPDLVMTVPMELGAPLGLAWAIGVCWLLLFALRHQLGWSVLTAAIAAVHAYAVLPGSEVEASPGLLVSSNWLSVTAWPFIVLLVHIREGTHRARNLAVAALAGTLVVTAAAAVLAADPVSLLIRGLCRGTLAFISATAALVAWEVLGAQRVTSIVPLRLAGAILFALAFDATAQGCFRSAPVGSPVRRLRVGAHHDGGGSRRYAQCARGRMAHADRRRTLAVDPASPLFDVLAVMLGTRRYLPMRPGVVREADSGLYHRTFLQDCAPIEFERAEHLAAPVAVIVIEARDDPSRVGRAMLSSMRLTDLPCRWSDQLYVALLPGANRDTARPQPVG